MADEPASPYRSVYLPAAMQRLRELARQGTAGGLQGAFADSFRAIDQPPTEGPMEWGDPIRRLTPNLHVYGRAVDTLYLTSVVDEPRRVVVVWSVMTLRGPGMGGWSESCEPGERELS